MHPFEIKFFIGDRLIEAVASPDVNDEHIIYRVKAGDLLFSIQPVESEAGTIIWVDADGETLELYRVAGNAIERYEM